MKDTAFAIPSHWRWADRPPIEPRAALAGHVVAVLYWRLGCPHARAALHELLHAVQPFSGEPLAVLAVHVATTAAERNDAQRRRLLARLPAPLTEVVTDRADEVTQLPTLVLVDEQGIERARAVGVPRSVRLRAALATLLRAAVDSGRAASVPFRPCGRRGDARLDPVALAHDGERLWVASGLRRQVLALADDGRVERVVGSGHYGDDDGAAPEAAFAAPVGLCVHDDAIVVTDAGSHTVRAIDRASAEVVTWCGNGQLGEDYVGGGYGRDQALSSPSGAVVHEGGLYLCNAGTDQLWQVDPMTGAAMAWLGDESGAGFDAPVAIARQDDALWVVEERAGSVSRVDLAHVARSDVPGHFAHPVAVAVCGERVLVADAAAAVVFAREPDGDWRPLLTSAHGLREPVALAVHGERLYIADAAADAILVVDLAADAAQPATLSLHGLPPLPDPAHTGAIPAAPLHLLEHCDVTLRLPTAALESGEQVEVDVIDEGAPLLAAPRHDVVAVRLGYAQVLLPVVGPGEGAFRIRIRSASGDRYYLAPVRVTSEGVDTSELRTPTA